MNDDSIPLLRLSWFLFDVNVAQWRQRYFETLIKLYTPHFANTSLLVATTRQHGKDDVTKRRDQNNL